MNRAEREVRALIAEWGIVDAGNILRSQSKRRGKLGAARLALINDEAWLAHLLAETGKD